MTPTEIKQLRKSRNETQKQFAVVVGVSVYTVSIWETGAHEPSGLALRRLHEVRDTKVTFCPLCSSEVKRVVDPAGTDGNRGDTRLRNEDLY